MFDPSSHTCDTAGLIYSQLEKRDRDRLNKGLWRVFFVVVIVVVVFCFCDNFIGIYCNCIPLNDLIFYGLLETVKFEKMLAEFTPAHAFNVYKCIFKAISISFSFYTYYDDYIYAKA